MQIDKQTFSNPFDYTVDSSRTVACWHSSCLIMIYFLYDIQFYVMPCRVISHHIISFECTYGAIVWRVTDSFINTSHSCTPLTWHNIAGVIGHEYFHNWTGNRVTVRDWFQLTLKEGAHLFLTSHPASLLPFLFYSFLFLSSFPFLLYSSPISSPSPFLLFTSSGTYYHDIHNLCSFLLTRLLSPHILPFLHHDVF